MIGSDGATLSGGQKQRLALARALYSRKELLLIDDVFSGLDYKTSKAVFRKIFGPEGLCKLHNMTVVLATRAGKGKLKLNRTSAICRQRYCASNHGTILEQGNFRKLRGNNDSYVKDLILHENPDEKSAEDSITGTTNKPQIKPESSEPNDINRQAGDFSVYFYFGKSVGCIYFCLFIGTVLSYTLSSEFQAVLLELWSKSEIHHSSIYTNLYMGLYAMLSILALCGIGGLLCVTLLFAGPYASINLHRVLLHTVMNAPYSWFPAIDSGVTLNRSSQDMSLIDMELLIGIVDTFAGFFMALAQAILIATGAKYIENTQRTRDDPRFWMANPFRGEESRTSSSLQKPYYLLYCIQRWLNLVLDLIIAGIAILLITFATQMRGTTSAGTLGIALLETAIGAVARVKSFEANTFIDEPAVRGNSFCIEGGTKLGDILIDDISISTLRRDSVRRSFITIPQEPYFLSGTVGFNADPFHSRDTKAIQTALVRVGLWDIVCDNGGLEAPMNATPLSQGQQQLFCIARALIRKMALGNKDHGILVLDEVTSNVDSASEEIMLRILDDEFKGWTVLAVAHRLGTIRRYDRVLVLDKGSVVEDGAPEDLIRKEAGLFKELWENGFGRQSTV
ncbi:hypothetical protein BPOR_0055g00110 [Botrytis porri]|uniref:ABC transporter domain-containing protein n=1 Tax=Botrytis porri TaxID=87229 RepID=A0A4Z1L1H8_9HELO|nr:hypothetical protein BPOR_0055g00110 [Botrytis porri]